MPAYWSLVDDNGQWIFKLDSFVYYEAVRQWLEGGDLYGWYALPSKHLWPFTYTPLAAWVIAPLTWMSYQSATVLLIVATPLCAAITAYATLRRLGARVRTAHNLAPWLALIGVIALEPFPKTMEYAQVNAILMALVAVDLLLVPERSRWRGVLSGLAAAIKLTPAVAILVLLARREWRAAATMAGSAVGLTVLAGLAAPAESWEFFTSAMWDPGRAGFADYSGNQNLKGAIARGLPESAWNLTWAACSLLTVLAAWFLCHRLDRLRGAGSRIADPVSITVSDTAGPGSSGLGDAGLVLALQVSVVMVLGLLISPSPGRTTGYGACRHSCRCRRRPGAGAPPRSASPVSPESSSSFWRCSGGSPSRTMWSRTGPSPPPSSARPTPGGRWRPASSCGRQRDASHAHRGFLPDASRTGAGPRKIGSCHFFDVIRAV